jgi:hypothetical protein
MTLPSLATRRQLRFEANPTRESEMSESEPGGGRSVDIDKGVEIGGQVFYPL